MKVHSVYLLVFPIIHTKKDLEVMAYRLQLTYDETVDVLNVKYVAGSTKGYTIPPGV